MRLSKAGFLAVLVAGSSLNEAPARAGDEPAARPTAPAATPVRPAAIPDTPAGRQLEGWLEAFNRVDREALRAFNLAHFSAKTVEELKRSDRTDMFWRAAEGMGGLDVANVRSRSDREILAEARARRGGEWVRIELTVEPQAPGGITLIALGPMPDPTSGQPTGKLAGPQLVKELGSLLDRLVAADEFSGVVLVAKDGEPIFAKAYGMAHQDRKVPVTLDTRFSLASMGKMFTAVAIVQLVEEGKLSYDDTIAKHLPDYPNKAAAARVTIHQLLTHTSGLGDFFNEKWAARRASIRSVKDYLDLFADEPLRFEPGTRWEYSNGGFVVLGAIIEKVTGRDYFEAVSERVFKKGGMTHSGFPTPSDAIDDMATGYTRVGPDDRPRPGPRASNADHAPGRGNPAGGAWSSAGDLLRFTEALRTGKLIGSRSYELATGPRAETGRGPDSRYGYGFMVHSVHGKKAFGHSGGFPGVSTALEVYPELGYTVVVLSNYDDGAPRVLLSLRDWLALD